MKEFVEKLIERLEEYPHAKYKDDYGKGFSCAINLAIKIINQLAEEYNQDSTKKNQGWILCSEKLPEKRSWYLALFKESSTGFVGLPYIADYLMGNHTNWTTKDGWIIKDCTDSDKANEYFKDLECVAWQPLPNPCSFTHEKELVEFCKPEEKPKFSNEELDRIMDKILDNQDLDKLKQEPKTRIEHIRSMSVEELADVILDREEISTAIDFCKNLEQCREDVPEGECRKCLIKWLNSSEEISKKIPVEHFTERFNRVM